jgi:hypothetical protein
MINLAVAAADPVPSTPTPRDVLLRMLVEFDALVAGIRTDHYATATFGSTVGQQVARSLSRMDSLLRGSERGTVRYAAGSPDLAVDPVAALKRIRALRVAATNWPPTPLSSVVRTVHESPAGDEDDTAWSTLGAEAAFVISETIDAQSLIATALRAIGVSVPGDFGESPLPALTVRASVPPVWALWKRLDEIAALLVEIPAHLYTEPAAGQVSGSVGAHVRHCLDHVSALLSADPSAILSYDRRRRGTPIEADPTAALQQIIRLKAALDRWAARSLDEPVRVASQIDPSGAAIVGWSTFGRELAFVLSHTIHHQATMAAVLALHGSGTPDGFGYAPSTPRH